MIKYENGLERVLRAIKERSADRPYSPDGENGLVNKIKLFNKIMFKKLEGYKTIIFGVLVMITAVLGYFGVIDNELSALLIASFLGGMGLSLGAKIERSLTSKK